MWMSVNNHASEPLRDPLPPFQAVGTTAQPMRNYCPLLRFGCYVVFDDCQRSTISSLCGRRRAKRRAVRVLLHACNIFAPTPTNSIKFPVCGSLFLYVPAPQVSQERSVNAKNYCAIPHQPAPLLLPTSYPKYPLAAALYEQQPRSCRAVAQKPNSTPDILPSVLFLLAVMILCFGDITAIFP